MPENIDISDGVRHLYLPGLNTVSRVSSYGFRQWILEQSTAYILAGPVADSFVIQYFNSKELLDAIASDINRLSCAALETVLNIQQTNKKSLGWSIIKYYYSAFFSACSILRVFGFGLVQIDEALCNLIKRRILTYTGVSLQISAGQFCVNVDLAGSTLTFYKVNRYNDSHRGTWKRFIEVLRLLYGEYITTPDLGANCLKKRELIESHPLSMDQYVSSGDFTHLTILVELLVKEINNRNDCNWLSKIRNEVNYSHLYGIWFPYNEFDTKNEKIERMRSTYLEDPLKTAKFYDPSENTIIKHVACCQMINAFNDHILMDLKERHPSNKSFIIQGYSNLRNHYIQALSEEAK